MGKVEKGNKKVEKVSSNEATKSTSTGVFQLEKIQNGLANKEVKCAPKRVPKVPSHMPKLPLLCGGFGVVKSGKTNSIVNMMQEYWDHKSLNLLYCISPTYDSNASIQTLPFEKDGIFTDSHHSVESLRVIIGKIKEKNMEYKFEKEYKRIYRLYFDGKGGESKLNYNEMNLLRHENFRAPVPIPWPCPGIFIDDMTHTELMANTIGNELSHLSLHHRHLDGVGVSIFQAFQTFKSGMPRVVRSNLACIMLFATCNMRELKEIYEEVSNHVTYDTFKRLFFEATKGEHCFLFINKMADDPCRQFGINFDQVFVIDPLEERRKLLKLEGVGTDEPKSDKKEKGV